MVDEKIKLKTGEMQEKTKGISEKINVMNEKIEKIVVKIDERNGENDGSLTVENRIQFNLI
jgi:peptidoglycan hydrolase CwlO-like protein